MLSNAIYERNPDDGFWEDYFATILHSSTETQAMIH